MNKPSIKLTALVKTLVLMLLINTFLCNTSVLSQVISVTNPTGGFHIDGDLKANTPTANAGDWAPGTGGTGTSVFDNSGNSLYIGKSYRISDAYGGNDDNFSSSKAEDNPNTQWSWAIGSVPNKNDVNNGLVFFEKDGNGDYWMMLGADRMVTTGTAYIDFELLQNTLTKNANFTFTSAGPHGGRTVGDINITVLYNNGGGSSVITYSKWSAKSGGGYEYVAFDPGATGYAMTNSGTVSVPFGAFGTTSYSATQFVEAGINLSKVVAAVSSDDLGLSIKSLLIKSKASTSATADLKDFTGPFQVAIKIPVKQVNISGKVYNDANGMRNGVIDGTVTNIGGTLYANLIDGGNNVEATTAVAANGTYSFLKVGANTNYTIVLSNVSGSTTSSLPSGWVSTGEDCCDNSGSDGTANGSISISTAIVDLTNINFGIEQIPVANAVTASSQVNPGGSIKVTVPTLNGSDPEQGSFPGTGNLDTVIIKTLPTDATLYYNNVAVVAGDTIKNYNPTLLMLDPSDVATTVSFTYVEVDAALQSSAAATVSMTFTTLVLSGNVYDDANALQDGMVNGAGTNAGNNLYAQLLNSSNTVIATTAIAANGTYSFAGLNAGTYSVLINTSSSASTSTTLPANWINTGEFNGTGVGNDGTVNGISASIVLSTSTGNINFGIEQLPTANAVSSSQTNPGGSIKVTVPALNGTDPEQGSFPGTGNSDTLIIKTLPTNGTLYYNNVAVVAGDTIKNYNPALLTLDPNDGAGTVSFTYVEVDAALQSSATASVSMTFTTLSLSGNVYNDANALQDAKVNGPGTNAGGTLYAQLLNSTNAVIATVAVANDGTFSFSGLNGGTYSVIINNSSSASTVTSLPTNWINTGEFNGTGVGNDGNVNGTSAAVTLSTTNVINVNFGVEQLPAANAVSAASQVNPGGTVKVAAPVLTGSDPEQGSFPGTGNSDTVIIKTLPTNGTLYYNNVAVVAGDTIKNYNPTLLMVDPNDGAITISFTYAEVDAALQSSDDAVASMNFTTISLSGNVYDDANALQDENVNGFGTNADNTLYVQLLNNSNAVIATTAVAANGTYTFAGLNGGTYHVVLNTSSTASSAPSVPTDWLNTGEFNGTGIGSDGTVNGISASVTLSTTNVTNVNFGVEQLPTANAVIAGNQVNPGGSVKVTVPTLNGNDPEQGSFPGTGNSDTVIIKTLPTNGTLYYNNVAVVAGDTIKNYNPTLLTVDPINGAITVSFTYAEVDAALQSSAAATVNMPFGTVILSGNVYDDANALQDGIVNGDGTNAGNTLYAQLLNSSNAVIATTAVASNGAFSFVDLNAGNYSVIINTSSSASTSTTLPANWIYTGEHNGIGGGSDGLVNGTSAVVTLSTANISNVNFGIEQLPTANATSTASQVNPGGTVKVVAPILNGSDPEQGGFPGTGNSDTVIIKTLPINGALYYNNAAVVAGDTIKNYNPTLLTVDPNDGAITVSFTYAEVDAALQSSGAATASMEFTTVSISGNVYDDADALQDEMVNGDGTNAGNTLYAQLLNNSNVVIATTAVAANGNYSFAGLNGGTYSVIINNSSSASTSTTLPANWIHTGEFNGTGVGNDGNVNGTSASVTLSTASIDNVNFGVEQLPTANAVTATSQVNPGGAIKVTVPTLNGSDPEQGIYDGVSISDTVIIKTLPANAALYYNNVLVAAGDTIKNYNPTLLMVDPNDGAITVSFSYVEIDAALQSSASALVSMDFTTISLSGNVYDDANALQDGIVNGAGTNAGNTLYAQLLNNSNNVIATTAVAANGTYSFAGLNGGTYSVLINTSSSASTSTALPTNWINTGEHNGTGAGSDGNVDGSSATVILSTVNVTNINFGVEQLPTTNAVTAANQVNPGGTVKVTVPALNGTDPEQGIFDGTSGLDTVIIKTLPTNGTLYYNNVAVVAGDVIHNYNPGLLTLDPNDGAITVSFTYAEIDAALQESATDALVSMSFTTISLSGNVYDDANALQDAKVNGVATNANNTLYAQLLDINGVVITTTAVAADGTYSFAGLNGGTYSVIVNNLSSASTLTTLPANWINTGEFNGTGVGNDGNVNGTSATVILSTTNVTNVNFGVEQLPTANVVTTADQVNPGGAIKITVPTLNGSDPEQGNFTGTNNSDTVIIRTLPTSGTLYYNNVAVIEGDTIKNYNPSLLTVDPNDGAVTISFTFAEVDAALQSSAPASVTMNFTTISLSGNVYDDANALLDGKVNGTGTNAGGTLYAQLLNSSNAVQAIVAVAGDGTYTFTDLDAGAYSVVINTSSTENAAAGLPTNFVHTGEYFGTGVGNDGSANGVLSIGAISTNVSNANFGIEQLPVADELIATSQVNPGGTVKVTVPALTGSDAEDGTYNGTSGTNTIIVNTLPTNGTLYYNNIALVTGDTIKNYNPSLLQLDPNDGAITVSFTFSEVDAANLSSTAVTASMTFSTISISGNVLDDANALLDGTVNGTGANAAGTLYAQLLNASNAVQSTVAVATDGTYSFSGLDAGTYSVVINTSSAANAVAVLPANYVHTGEYFGTGVGNDGSANGVLLIGAISTTVSNANFGIEQLPVADELIASSQVNPGGTVKVTVSALTGSDAEDGTYNGTSGTNTIIVNTLPTNGTLYYNNVAVVTGDTIKNYNPTLLQLDPNDGAITVSFTFSEVDAANLSSSAVTASMTFSTITISGNVLDDANALLDGTVNGTGTNAAGTLYAQLLNASNAVQSTVAVATDGTYSFSGLDAGTYSVVINTSAAANAVAVLPANYVHTGEYFGTGVGNDGSANGVLSIGAISTNVSNANFGIEQLPVADELIASSQVNPGGTVKVTVSALTGSDAEDGTYNGTSGTNTIIVNTLPTNGILYYNNIAVVAGDTIKNYNPSLLQLDPNDGAITVSFTFSEVDAANLSSSAVTASMTFSTISISGNVLDDANALLDGTVNGTGTNAAGTLYAQLLNASNAVQSTVAVAADGTYSFAGLSGGTYTVLINTSASSNNAASLPAGWLNTGEFNGTGVGNDGTTNGVSASIVLSSSSIANINFGIEFPPVANDVTAASQVNPGGTVKVSVPTLNGSDLEDGDYNGISGTNTIIINSLPTNAVLYYNNVAVVAGDSIKNYDPSSLKVDPNNGSIKVTFTYSEVDAALQSSEPATVTMDFGTLSISGYVFEDKNGLVDSTVNGPGTNADDQIYALLLDDTNSILATYYVSNTGYYIFNDLNAGTPYTVSIHQIIIPKVTPHVKIGENIGTGPGNDGNVDGILHIGLISANVTNANFGIEQIPFADLVIAPAMPNPGGTTKVAVPVLSGGDAEDGIYDGVSGKDTIIIQSLPTNGILYYNGIPVVAGDTIKNYEPSLLTVDPANGAVTVNFNYSEVDEALQSSEATTVSMSFTTLKLSGNVYDDANGLTDGTVNGIGTNVSGNLYAQLLNSSNVVIETTGISNDGTYSFSGLNGGTYTVLINTSSTASTSNTLPNNWVNTGEFNGTGAGSDGTINGKSATIILSAASVTNVNFGIEQLPTANAVTTANQINPGGSVKVAVPTLNGSDPEQGNFAGTGNADTIIIKTLPTNAVLYYNNIAVVAGDTIKNYNPSLLMVDPNNGTITLSFTYSEVDAALQSSAPATVTMSFGTISISGNVYNDANGLTDGIVNGDPTNANSKLHVQLVNSSNIVIATTAVSNAGTYSFTGLDGGEYTVVLTKSSAPSVVPSLPGYINTGDNLGAGPGDDGSVDGILSVGTISTNITDANFGIEHAPVANPVISTGLFNPGGTIKVAVPVLNGGDQEDGEYDGYSGTNTVIIETLPNNAVLYYNDVPVIKGDTIKNYDPSLLFIDPNDGFITVTFKYSEVDVAMVSSVPVNVQMPFVITLPVALSNFSGKVNGNKVEVNWASETEINTKVYEVERSNDGLTFNTIGKVDADNKPSTYNLTDVMPVNGYNYYRLKTIDKDGKFEYSKVITVKVENDVITITSIKPNPFVSSIDIYMTLVKASEVKINITDVIGRTVYQNNVKGTTGVNWVKVNDLDRLSSGMYIITVKAGNAVTQQKLLKGK